MNKLLNLSDFCGLFVYRVEEGDTIKGISEKFHAAETAIIAINALEEEVIPGDIILIEKTDGELYEVQPEDTIESISGGNKDKMFEIIKKNKTDVFYVGQRIYI